jgi:hypothetical protein
MLVKTGQILATVLFALCIHVNGQTTNNAVPNAPVTSHKKIMPFKLTNERNHKVIADPTDADIRGMVAFLTDDFDPVLTLQTPGDAQYLTMDEIGKGKYGFSCKDGKIAYITKKGRECSSELAIKIIISYRDQTQEWKNLGQWERVPL